MGRVRRLWCTGSVLALLGGAAVAHAAPPSPPPERAQPQAGGPPVLTLAAVNGANVVAASEAKPAKAADATDPVLIRAEVLLDRANFKPGVIDGRMGENVANALSAYAKAHGLPDTRTLTPQLLQALVSADGAPALKTYTITAEDVAGPWSPDVGENFVKMSEQSSLNYTSAQEMLAARFHMDPELIKALNPQADLAKAGQVITVVDPGAVALPGPVRRLVVDKATASVTAFGGDGKVMAVFPATVGSTERPSPHGTWKVKGVRQNPDYVYDPKKLSWGPKRAGKLHIPPGPRNPVGVVWIALTAPDYGIHGAPDPRLVGKTASHGCVRLTNWDAEELSKAVKFGVPVEFVGARRHAPRRAA
jgi:lipoprotein-anchoring transpeptidase ErfK/SrfK